MRLCKDWAWGMVVVSWNGKVCCIVPEMNILACRIHTMGWSLEAPDLESCWSTKTCWIVNLMNTAWNQDSKVIIIQICEIQYFKVKRSISAIYTFYLSASSVLKRCQLNGLLFWKCYYRLMRDRRWERVWINIVTNGAVISVWTPLFNMPLR